MPDATKRPIAGWRETEWLQHLQRQAQQLTACPQSAADLAHSCLIAFYDHHRRYPWQHPEPARALRWCCQKLRALACDAHRHAERHPCLALETLPESIACVDIAAQVQADIDGERFVASLPSRLRAAVELRLAGYSWDEAAQQLGVSASTLRGYLPDLRAKFVDFFGYDPSKWAFESLIRAEGKTAPSADRGGDDDEGDTRIDERLCDDTEHAGGGKSLSVWRGKRLSLHRVRTVLMVSKGHWQVLFLCLTVFVLSSAPLPSQSSDQATDPWETHPLLLSYLIFTEVSPPRSTEEYECARQELYQTLSLSVSEIDHLVKIAAQEHDTFLWLKRRETSAATPADRMSLLVVPECLPQVEPVLPVDPVGDWEAVIWQIHRYTDSALQQLLGAERYSRFRVWVMGWWQRHQAWLQQWLQPEQFQPAADIQVVRVFATQYIPEAGECAREVALPDRYIKFANRRWCNDIPQEYRQYYRCPANPLYTVDILRDDRSANDVPVWEVGPWNVDDNYWNNYPPSNSGAPRRTPEAFEDDQRCDRFLNLGEPEAQAAHREGYNPRRGSGQRSCVFAKCSERPPKQPRQGCDQFCRIVTNPAGIDLSPVVARELGLRSEPGQRENAWVIVVVSRLP